MKVVVREFDPKKDSAGAEAVETMCDVGSNATGEISLFTDLLGDLMSRVRHSPAYLMLVAETSDHREIVGLIRGCIKTVTCDKKTSRNGKPPSPLYSKVAYILGLRVSPYHRRRGIGIRLVIQLEQWFREMGAEYAYMATEKDNAASVCLFAKCGYSKFRTPSILVHPVFAHRLSIHNQIQITKMNNVSAESLYRSRFSTVEFFPRDIDSVLTNPLCLGTFLATDRHSSWAVASVWNCSDVFKLQVRGASKFKKTFAKATRVIDKAFPWFGIPSVPNLFQPFGLYFVFGIGGEGPRKVELVEGLFRHVHNLGRKGGVGVVATEVAEMEPVRKGIPHWKVLSCEEDLWCVKRLGEDYSDGTLGDWTKSVPGPSIFVDPREF